MKRVLITGSSGYFGSTLVSYLAAKPEIEEIVGTDVKPPMERNDKLAFYQRDVRNRTDDLMRTHRVDTVIHAAWVLPPIHDTARMEDININGTKAVLDSILSAGAGQLLYTSSTTAYGFHPDNESPLTETSPLRGNEDFTYSKCKRIVESLVQDFAKNHLGVVVTIVRPCFVVGPGFNNPLANHLRKRLVLLPRPREALQFVHEQDLVEVIYQILIGRRSGIYNIVGDGLISFDEMVSMLGGYSSFDSFQDDVVTERCRLVPAAWFFDRVPQPGPQHFSSLLGCFRRQAQERDGIQVQVHEPVSF